MYYDYYETGVIGLLALAGDETGLKHIYFQKEQASFPAGWRRVPEFLLPAKSQLKAYFGGELKQFDLPLAPEGTAFQLEVWAALQKVPYGKLVCYQDVAEAVGRPNAARAVGGATGRNPIPIIIPCHRVIGRNGTLTGFGGGLEIKHRLIALEGAAL